MKKHTILLLLAVLIASAKTYKLQPPPTKDQLAADTTVELKVNATADPPRQILKKRSDSKKSARFRWGTNLDSAVQEAGNRNVPVLVLFTGSDWCYWCKKLDREVFSQDVFKEYAARHFVLCKLDFPQNKSGMTKEQQNHNSKASYKYGVHGYPTVLLLDANGKEIARTGYQEGGAAKYIYHLKSLLKK